MDNNRLKKIIYEMKRYRESGIIPGCECINEIYSHFSDTEDQGYFRSRYWAKLGLGLISELEKSYLKNEIYRMAYEFHTSIKEKRTDYCENFAGFAMNFATCGPKIRATVDRNEIKFEALDNRYFMYTSSDRICVKCSSVIFEYSNDTSFESIEISIESLEDLFDLEKRTRKQLKSENYVPDSIVVSRISAKSISYRSQLFDLLNKEKCITESFLILFNEMTKHKQEFRCEINGYTDNSDIMEQIERIDGCGSCNLMRLILFLKHFKNIKMHIQFEEKENDKWICVFYMRYKGEDSMCSPNFARLEVHFFDDEDEIFLLDEFRNIYLLDDDDIFDRLMMYHENGYDFTYEQVKEMMLDFYPNPDIFEFESMKCRLTDAGVR